MIRVYYCYKRKRDGKWRKSFRDFYDCRKALAFMKSIDAPNKESFITGWDCDNPDDNEWLYQRHVLQYPKGE